MIMEHAANWLGYPVELFSPEEGADDYKNTVYRLAVEYDSEEPLVELFARFLENPASAETPAIIFGLYGENDSTSQPLVEALVAARQRLPKLKGVFLGDILSEENEISWIHQSDVSPLFSAFPELEHFRVRGGNELTLGRIRHDRLKSLVIETGGLPATVLRDVLASKMPALEHLELWLGDSGYGWDGTVDDLQPLFPGELFPKLKYLGLRDSQIQDEVAIAISKAPILQQLEVLDLSLGTLGDAGGMALVNSPGVKRLRKLDLRHHYLSPEVEARLQAIGIAVDLGDKQKPDEYKGESHRYVAVSE